MHKKQECDIARDRYPILLLILKEFKRINDQLLFPLKSSQNLWFYELIRFNSRHIGNEIWRWFIIFISNLKFSTTLKGVSFMTFGITSVLILA